MNRYCCDGNLDKPPRGTKVEIQTRTNGAVRNGITAYILEVVDGIVCSRCDTRSSHGEPECKKCWYQLNPSEKGEAYAESVRKLKADESAAWEKFRKGEYVAADKKFAAVEEMKFKLKDFVDPWRIVYSRETYPDMKKVDEQLIFDLMSVTYINKEHVIILDENAEIPSYFTQRLIDWKIKGMIDWKIKGINVVDIPKVVQVIPIFTQKLKEEMRFGEAGSLVVTWDWNKYEIKQIDDEKQKDRLVELLSKIRNEDQGGKKHEFRLELITDSEEEDQDDEPVEPSSEYEDNELPMKIGEYEKLPDAAKQALDKQYLRWWRDNEPSKPNVTKEVLDKLIEKNKKSPQTGPCGYSKWDKLEDSDSESSGTQAPREPIPVLPGPAGYATPTGRRRLLSKEQRRLMQRLQGLGL